MSNLSGVACALPVSASNSSRAIRMIRIGHLQRVPPVLPRRAGVSRGKGLHSRLWFLGVGAGSPDLGGHSHERRIKIMSKRLSVLLLLLVGLVLPPGTSAQTPVQLSRHPAALVVPATPTIFAMTNLNSGWAA